MAEEKHMKNTKGYEPFKTFGAVKAILISLISILVVVNILLINNLNKPATKTIAKTVPSTVNITPPITPPVAGFTNVTLTVLFDSSCKECNETVYVQSFEEVSNNLQLHFNTKMVDYKTTEGNELVVKYNITKIPTVLLSKEALTSELLAKAWPNSGTIEKDGTLVLRNIYPPYRDLITNEITGKVRLIELNDSSCTICYDVSTHKQTLEMRFLVKIVNTSVYDINSNAGSELVKKYNITRVPTVLISPELKTYFNASPAFAQIWEQVATTESDGWYVFRALELMGNITYKDLTTNKTESTG